MREKRVKNQPLFHEETTADFGYIENIINHHPA